MLAYVFWHAPAEGVGEARYEQALVAFHRSLARGRPFGFEGSAAFRIDAPPWEETAALGPPRAAHGEWYEDWYLLEDFTALGVLGEAAVGRGHRASHERAASGFGRGTAGVYRLLEGERASARAMLACAHATWVAPAAGPGRGEIGAMLADGAGDGGESVWQRQLVLGPAPEFCVLSREPPAGVAQARLAPQWSARAVVREALFDS